MAQYEIVLMGESREAILAKVQTLAGIEPGVYGKRWNPDGSLTVMIRSEQAPENVTAALEKAATSPARPPRGASVRGVPNNAPALPEAPVVPDAPADTPEG